MIAVAAAYDCPAPNAFAELIDGEIPDAPPGAAKAKGTVVVRVALSDTGAIRSTKVERSSGNPRLDAAAVAGARDSTYSPPCRNDRPVSGTYVYVTSFGR